MKLYFMEEGEMKIELLENKIGRQRGDVIFVASKEASDPQRRVGSRSEEKGGCLMICEEDLDLLIRLCGEKNIRSGKIRVYTPELFLREKMEKEPERTAFLKLEQLCLWAKGGVIRSISAAELGKSEMAKYISFSRVFVWEAL
ncbi:MAG: hypothetical protein Q4A75_03915 [Peptostreptococcaceae bacterium]|nr:hypothetical protein [Peptostreptococcaceae bacterium]